MPNEAALPGPVVGAPPRRPGSVRRTATIDMGSPDGPGGPLRLLGRARDLLTPEIGDPVVLDEAEMRVTVGDHRTITAIDVRPDRAGIERLVGVQGGVYLRSAIDDALPTEREAATALHVLLDDIAGTPDDPWGWHAMPPRPEVAMRRHRRIDVWRDGEGIMVDDMLRCLAEVPVLAASLGVGASR